MPRRKRTSKHTLTLDGILADNLVSIVNNGDVIDLLAYGPLLDTSAEEERAMLEAYDSQLAWEVRQRMKERDSAGRPGSRPGERGYDA